MKAFCMDVHISVIADFKSICPNIEVVDWCLSGHAWVMKRPQDNPKFINANTWRNLTKDMIEKFQKEYDNFLSTFDFFIVGYASVFVLLFEKYNKPILMLNAVRYDVPFCQTKNSAMLEVYERCLQRLYNQSRLLIVSNNKADQLYLLRGCNIQSQYIPSICDYTHVKYSPKKSTFLCYHGSVPNHPLITQKQELSHPHTWDEITHYKGIISIPYEISLMSLFEQFTMGMPFFFPSKAFWKSKPDIQSISAYWVTLPRHFQELKDLSTWIDLADMYDAFQSPNTYYFDSFPHLIELLESFVYVNDSEFRKSKSEQVKKAFKEYLLKYQIT